MDESVFEVVKKTLDENATISRCCTIHLLINACKEKGIAEADVRKAIERMQMNAHTYIMSESICIIE